jgi:hypothetical protein
VEYAASRESKAAGSERKFEFEEGLLRENEKIK